jgi:hypothetical protein
MYEPLIYDPGEDDEAEARGAPLGTWAWRAALGVFVALLLLRAWQVRHAPFEQIDWAFESRDELFLWLRGLVWRELRILGLSFVLGLLTAPAVGPIGSIGDLRVRWLVRLGMWCCGWALIVLCFVIAWREIPPAGSLVLPLGSYLVGWFLSSAALRGPRSLAWAGGTVAAALVLLLIGARLAAGMAMSPGPLEIVVEPMTAADKRQLADQIRASRSQGGEQRALQFSDAEINALVNTAMRRTGANRTASVHFGPGGFSSQMSLIMPQRWWPNAFLNAQVTGSASIDHGHLTLALHELRVGYLTVPSLVLRVLSSTLHAMLMEDPQIRRIVQAVYRMDMTPGEISIKFQQGALARQVVPALVQLLWERPDVAFETEIFVRHLVAFNDRITSDDLRFGFLMREAFLLAQARSQAHSPTLENRAAIFALAIVMGHPDLEPFVGELFDEELEGRVQQIVGRATLRGRHDAPRHFLLSSALALLSNESTSDLVGQLKEQLDSQHGGSGFSFADMLANSAGTRFALEAVRDEASARAVQARMARGFHVDAILPPLDDLPEGLTADEFRNRFGGVGGPGYQAMLDEINRRLDALPRDGASQTPGQSRPSR